MTNDRFKSLRRARGDGEGWFFLPRPWLDAEQNPVLKNQSIRAHTCEFLYRASADGGTRVFVKGAVQRNGREIAFLPYWHQIAPSAAARETPM